MYPASPLGEAAAPRRARGRRTSPLRRARPCRSPNAASKSGDAAATSPYPLAPLSPTLPPCPPTAACHPISKDQPPLRSNAPPALAAGRLRVHGLPCLATTCFPLSISGHFSPRPSASVRLAPWQIRLVPLCRPFRRPPTGAVNPRPGHAWQIRFVSLCRLVQRGSNPSCAASLQARAGRKFAHTLFRSNQIPLGGGSRVGQRRRERWRAGYCSGRGGCHHLLVSLTRRWVTHFTQS